MLKSRILQPRFGRRRAKGEPSNTGGFEGQFVTRLCSGIDPKDASLIAKALRLALEIDHIESDRPTGIEVATVLKKLDVDAETIQAALLSDPRLRESLDQSCIERSFGAVVAKLVKNVHWLNTFRSYSTNFITQPEQAETLRQMLLSMVDDVRAVIIKLAYRIQRLRNLSREDCDGRRYIAQETLDIFAPLANRLGISSLKWELEDFSFRYIEPLIYKKLASFLADNRVNRERFLNGFSEDLKALLKNEGIAADVFGRPKHIYSIWKKMQRKHLGVDELFDIRGIRILVDKVSECYQVLGLVHGRWNYMPKEFDDYIANPKANGYQSLHTVIAGPQGALVEIQIRSREMDRFAEIGIAAHWKYKEGGAQNAALKKSVASIRSLLEDKKTDEDLLTDFRAELYADRIFVLTPNGDIKNLMKGATALDFAYAIHTEVGHRCRGAKVNGRIVPLTYQLKSGEQVEILTANHGGPNQSWINSEMGYLHTAHAVAKVRAWFRQRDHKKNLREGKAIVEKVGQRLGLKDLNLNDLAKHFHCSGPDELLIRVGRGDLNSTQFASALTIRDVADSDFHVQTRKLRQNKYPDNIHVQGMGNMLTHIAQCCKPVPGDSIIGYITIGRGVAIHDRACRNILRLTSDKLDRLIEADWGKDEKAFPVKVRVEAIDRRGLLRDITQILSNSHVKILDATIHSDREDLSVHMNLILEVKSLGELSKVLEKMNQLRNVLDASRKN